jgi:hypothetical protein
VLYKGGWPRSDFRIGNGSVRSAAVRISHRHRFIFFSFPKTGSESVRLALDPISDVASGESAELDSGARQAISAHIRPPDLRSIFNERGWPFDEYYRFVFVRNPWTRLVSLYRMIRRSNPRFQQPFDQWLVETRPSGAGGCVGSSGRLLYRRYGTYALDEFVCDERGKRLVDDVFRMEDMPIVPAKLREKGIPLPVEFMPVINRASRVDIADYYTPALKAVVAMRYAKDIEEFRYSYPG